MSLPPGSTSGAFRYGSAAVHDTGSGLDTYPCQGLIAPERSISRQRDTATTVAVSARFGDMSFLCYLSATGLCPARVVLLLG